MAPRLKRHAHHVLLTIIATRKLSFSGYMSMCPSCADHVLSLLWRSNCKRQYTPEETEVPKSVLSMCCPHVPFHTWCMPDVVSYYIVTKESYQWEVPFFYNSMFQLVTVTRGLLRHVLHKWLFCVPTLDFLMKGYVPMQKSFAPHSRTSFLTVSSPTLGERDVVAALNAWLRNPRQYSICSFPRCQLPLAKSLFLPQHS